MLIGSLDSNDVALDYPALVGKRVLVTGVSIEHGVEVARALAEHKTRMVLHIGEDCPEMQALAEVVAQSALELNVFTGSLAQSKDAVSLARRATECFGGLDAAVNIAALNSGSPDLSSTAEEVENQVADLLAAPCLITRVVANRMRTMLTEGLILNVVPVPRTPAWESQPVADFLRAALGAITRGEARAWAKDGIRINAVAPAALGWRQTQCITGEPDLATLVLHLIGGCGRDLSGLVFEAAA